MDLTLEQQFEKRKLVDAAQTLNEEQLLAQIKQANVLLKQKSYCLDSFLQTGELNFLDTNDSSFMFNQLLTNREFEKYNREQLLEVLSHTVETLMHTDNHFRESVR